MQESKTLPPPTISENDPVTAVLNDRLIYRLDDLGRKIDRVIDAQLDTSNRVLELSHKQTRDSGLIQALSTRVDALENKLGHEVSAIRAHTEREDQDRILLHEGQKRLASSVDELKAVNVKQSEALTEIQASSIKGFSSLSANTKATIGIFAFVAAQIIAHLLGFKLPGVTP